MNWLFPGFLMGGLLIGLPIALHFLRSRPKAVVRFSTLRFLGPSAVRDTHRHRLRRWITLALRCLVLGLLAAAFARPFWLDARTAHGQVMVIALDNSMSMQAGERWGNGRNWALDQLGELQPGDHAGVLTMYPHPTWLVPLTDDLGAVSSALLSLKPGFEKTHYAEALQVASEALAANPAETKTLVWVADEQRLGWLGVDLSQTLPARVKIRFSEPVPDSQNQAAILSVEKGAKAGADELRVNIRLFQPMQQTRRLTVLTGKKILVSQDITLQSGDNPVTISLPVTNPAPDGWRVSLNPDDLPADDTAWLASGSAAGNPVLLDPASGTDFLADALNSTKRLGPDAIEPGKLPDTDWPTEAVVILRGPEAFRSPLQERLNHFADAGGSLWIFLDGSPEQTAWLQARGIQIMPRPVPETSWHLQDWDPEHPILAAFAGESLVPLLEVEFHRGFNLTGDTLAPIANWPDGAIALATCHDHGRRLFLAGFPLDRDTTNWPVQSSFVPFVHQTVRWLGSLGSARGDWRIGSTIPLPGGAGTWRALDSPAPQAPHQVRGSVRPDAPGLYEFTSGATRRVFAVNVPTEESDLTPWPDARQLAGLESKEIVRQHPRQNILPLSHEVAENQQRLWWWLLAFCGVALLAELALANRTSR